MSGSRLGGVAEEAWRELSGGSWFAIAAMRLGGKTAMERSEMLSLFRGREAIDETMEQG